MFRIVSAERLPAHAREDRARSPPTCRRRCRASGWCGRSARRSATRTRSRELQRREPRGQHAHGLPERRVLPGGRVAVRRRDRRDPASTAATRCCTAERRDDRRARLVRLLPAELLRPDPAALAALHDLPVGHGGARQDLRAARRGARPGRRRRRHRAAPVRGEIRFDDVSFSYGTGDDTALAPTSTSRCRPARPSRWSARPAPASQPSPSSSPASTTRPRDASPSTATTCATSRERSLRSQLGVVPQEGFLFSGRSRDNIAFGRPDATDEEVRDAARAVGADEFIERLPTGTTPRWASAAATSRPGSGSWSPSPARPWPIPAS